MSDQKPSVPPYAISPRDLAEKYDVAVQEMPFIRRKYRHAAQCWLYDRRMDLIALLAESGQDGVAVKGGYYRLIKSGDTYTLQREEAVGHG